MAGIYIHIPFCKQACHYCNFHFSTNQSLMQPMIDAICKEFFLRKHFLQTEIFTIYFGGGTPSLLSKKMLSQILQAIKTNYIITTTPEITLEANPDDITEDNLIAWKEIGINRLSIGIQSFFEEHLQTVNRAHNVAQALHCLQLATKYFTNISIDLIYGIQNLSNEQWLHNINTALSFNVPHISCYALTVEPKTAMEKLIAAKKMQQINTDVQAEQFEILTNTLQNAGFEHYEISNFAKPNFRSQHNSSYWQAKHYLGIGPSAHSFNGNSRQWNISNNALYIKAIESGNVLFEQELLTKTQQQNEYVMIQLRTIEGISLKLFEEKFGQQALKNLQTQAHKWLTNACLQQTNFYLQLTKKGKFLADGIAADLFSDEV